MNSGGIEFSQSGSVAINDGNWHHLLVEVNRPSSLVTVYTDCISANGSGTGTIPSSAISLTNTSNFFVGKNKDGSFFSGIIDFIRISKGTLTDAKTTIDELYKWEFNGPFLRDFAGIEPVGKRDASALEKGGKLCDITVSPDLLNFNPDGGSQTFTIDAKAGFEIIGKNGSFFTYTVNDTVVTVNVQSTTSGLPRSGEIIILGCNETTRAKIIQQYPEKIDNPVEGKIKVMPNPVSGDQIIISIPENIKSSHARLMDIYGKLIFEKVLLSGDNSMNITCAHGLYLLNISTPAFNYTTKIVID
jgi:hypothetical protein